jgi:hypothetical protein
MASSPITCFKDYDLGHGPYVGTPARGPIPPALSPIQSLPSPNNIYACSGNVFAGSRGVHRQGDIRPIHITLTNPPTPELPSLYGGRTTFPQLPWLAKGSTTSYANSKQIGRVGDPIICGSTILTGNKSVIIGD